ncbi:DUF3604 domain-containing protein [Glaciecola punicea]|jgi:hypothetical protein|uniref:DUF3604 domain-containing protein n=1 Tax=Glaciecola punicea TaxID=56804 RepID=UPI0009F739A7|nr:DUF3604 domain-containing protein [Glaciecola punicea]
MIKKVAIVTGLMVIAVTLVLTNNVPDGVYKFFPGYFEDHDKAWSQTPLSPTSITPLRLPNSVIEARATSQQANTTMLGYAADKQILFGDTHVHTTNSADAFMYSLPMMHGASGAFPPAFACDYARFVSQLDFYFLTDHAESFTRNQWLDGIESVRQCNRTAGDPTNPDIVAFVGWEWTQVGTVAENHFGHHNVLFKDDDPAKLPMRPIASVGVGVATIAARSNDGKQSAILGLLDPRHKEYYASYNTWVGRMAATPACDPSIASPDLPANCYESAATPGELFSRLDQWGFDTIVVPHGTSWGFYTPPNANWKHQLTAENSDSDKTRLIEVYSGHGNSEVFRDFTVRTIDADGHWSCPEPQENYLPACWQAGEIIRDRCLAAHETDEVCNERARDARFNFVQVDTIFGFMTVPGSTPEEWLDAGQMRDGFLPAFNYKPRKSVQYGLALQNLDDPTEPLGYRWGFIASTDTHSARAGHGFKQTKRLQTTDSTGVRDSFWGAIFASTAVVPDAAPVSLRADQIDPVSAKIFASEFERSTSFLSTGGLAAVHADGRDRDAIWNAMKRREVYGTSGHRMLLWFDLINAPENAPSPMGSVVKMTDNPRFKARVVGSFKQLPGCPDYVVEALDSRRLEKMSLGECYYPSDDRYLIERIEIIKIRPQITIGEAVAPLIEDPWRQFECTPSAKGCVIEFEDADFAAEGRNALYYIRAIEEPIETINGGNLRTKFNADGESESTDPCFGDFRTAESDQCKKLVGQQAWSSPIFVDYK